MLRHTENPINKVVYTGPGAAEYCAVSGQTIYKGDKDIDVTLSSDVTLLKPFVVKPSQVMLAVGLAHAGQVCILKACDLTRQIVI